MEQDILATTGCKWSKILFPGFRGVRPSMRENFISAERLIKECHIRNKSDNRMAMSTPTKKNNFMSAIKDSSKKQTIMNDQDHPYAKSAMAQSLLDTSLYQSQLMKVSPFMNDIIKHVEKHEEGGLNVFSSL